MTNQSTIEKNKYKATWVSNSSISDFIKCPKSYYYKNIYKDVNSFQKIALMTPSLALGQVVHATIDSIAMLPCEMRFESSLYNTFEFLWKGISGIKGGFVSDEEESSFKLRGKKMIDTIISSPGPLLNKAIRLRGDLPNYYLSESEDIILCGKIDWLEYIPENNSLHIIDFKTGKNDEDNESLQLPIYQLLVSNCQNRPISKASYWYLDRSLFPEDKRLGKINDCYDQIISIARDIKIARENRSFDCPRNGCYACNPYRDIVEGKAKYIGQGEYNRMIFVTAK